MGPESKENLKQIHNFRETLRSLRDKVQPPSDIEDSLEAEAAYAQMENRSEARILNDQEEMGALRESLGLHEEETPQKDEESGTEIKIEQTAKKELERLLSEVFEDRNLEQAAKDFSQRILSFLSGKAREQFSEKTLQALDNLYQNEKLINDLVGRMSAGSTTELAGVLLKIFNKFKEQVPKNYFQETAEQLAGEKELDSSRLKTIASLGIDFIPVVGPGKMLIEAKNGKTLDGTKLKGWKRSLHALEGGAFLILDLTGVGAVGTKVAKGSVLGGKLFTRSAAMARKIGLSREIYTPLYKTGKAITRNKTLANIVDKTFNQFITKRRFYGRSDARRAG